MAGKVRRGDLELVDDRHKLARLALMNPGATSSELAAIYEHEYGKEINPRTVRYDLQELKKKWLQETKKDMAIVRARELVRIDTLEQSAWDAWRSSMQPLERVVVERLHQAVNAAAQAKVAGELAGELADKNEYITQEVLEAIIRDAIADSVDSGEDEKTFINKITTTTEIRIGDPRYLAQIHSIQQERRKILGVYAPELHQLDIRKVEIKGYTGGWSPDDWKSDDIIEGDVEQSDDVENAVALLGVEGEK